MTEQAQRTRQRRRGEELEAALLEAAWGELAEVGYARMTMESVAARAKTGVAVLYRRWPNKDELVLACINHYGNTRRLEIPNTGNLRDDMIALLSEANETRAVFAAAIIAAFSGLLSSSGLTPAEVREKVLGDRRVRSEDIYARAQARGEIDLSRISPAVLALPFDLMRHDMLMTYKPISRERVLAIVDDIFLPLVEASRRG